MHLRVDWFSDRGEREISKYNSKKLTNGKYNVHQNEFEVLDLGK